MYGVANTYRESVKAIKPFIRTVEHLRRELSWGLSTSRSLLEQQLDSKSHQPLRKPARDLGGAVLVSMSIVRDVVSLAFRRGIRAHDFSLEKESIKISKQAISTARNVARDELAKIFDPTIKEPGYTQDDASELCLAVISLLQVR